MKTKVLERIGELCDNELITLWTEYQDGCNSCNQIYSLDDSTIECIFGGMSAVDIIREATDIDFRHNYLYCDDVYGWQSTNDLDEVIEVSDIVNWLVDCNGISSVIDLDELEEEDEE